MSVALNAKAHALLDSLTTPRVNPHTGKCENLPILSLRNQYARAFHLSWLAFFVAFLSWFAFSPLLPAIKSSLHLTPAQIANSNIFSLCATLLVRLGIGPCVDRFGPRRVMAALLVLGAVPSALAGTAHTAGGLYAVRFFIGILGATFVPCQVWTTAFFSTRVVGRANALAAGWGNAGGGVTFVVMVALFDSLTQARHLSAGVAWRVAFVVVPVPVLLGVAALVLWAGTDRPEGNTGAEGNERVEDGGADVEKKGHAEVVQVSESAPDPVKEEPATILASPQTWLPAIAYLTTFGFELAVEANLATVLVNHFQTQNLGQTNSGYLAGIYGLLNIFTRPLGGYLGDSAWMRFGVSGKKYMMLGLGFMQGAMALALGLYIDGRDPKLSVVIGLSALTALFNEAANGANFSLVPHIHPRHNGFMSGLVGAAGNLGGVLFALVFRFQPTRAFWICGVVTMSCNLLLIVIRLPPKPRGLEGNVGTT